MSVASTAASRSASSITTSGPLPPISSSVALPAAACATWRPVAVEPMKRDAVDARVASDLVADDRAGTGDEVEHARAAGRRRRCTRRARPRRPRSTAPASRRPRCRSASAGAISSAGIVYGQFHGLMIADHAARAAHQHHALAGRERIRQLAAEALGVLGRHPPVLDQLVDLVVGLGAQRLALVERQRPRELVAARLDDVADGVHLRRALERGQPRPAVGRVARGRDRATRVVAVALRARCRSARRWPGSSPSNVSPVALGCQSPPMNICCTVPVVIGLLPRRALRRAPAGPQRAGDRGIGAR